MKKIILITLQLFCINLYSQIPNYVPSNGLVGWWPFTGNANDISSNGNNGNVTGATLTADRNGNVNCAYSFDGNDYITVLNNANLNTNYITVSLWFQTTSTNSSSLIYKTNDNALNEQYACVLNYPSLNNNVWSVKNGNNCNSPSVGWNTINANYNVSDGSWHNITCTYDGLSKFYLDNVLITNNSTISTNIDLCGGKINIGKGYNSTYPFLGKIDDIGIWDRALTQTEITALYNGTLSSETFTNTTNFQLYPNPANDVMQFKCTEMVEKISIYNALGQLVQENKTNGMEGAISIEHLAQGSYFVKINNQKTSYTLLKN